MRPIMFVCIRMSIKITEMRHGYAHASVEMVNQWKHVNGAHKC